jgi:hypothetical protein
MGYVSLLSRSAEPSGVNRRINDPLGPTTGQHGEGIVNRAAKHCVDAFGSPVAVMRREHNAWMIAQRRVSP